MLINQKGQDPGSSAESANTKTWYLLVPPWCQMSEWGNLQVWSLGGKTEIKIKCGHNCRTFPLHRPRLKICVWKIQLFTYPRFLAPSWQGGAAHEPHYKAVPCSCALTGLSQTSHQTSILTSLTKLLMNLEKSWKWRLTPSVSMSRHAWQMGFYRAEGEDTGTGNKQTH